jgi:predicted HicB family RNase H-like nuclease
MKTGRKPLVEGQASAVLSFRLPEKLHDDACQVALKQGVPVAAVIRAALAEWLKDQHGACLWL